MFSLLLLVVVVVVVVVFGGASSSLVVVVGLLFCSSPLLFLFFRTGTRFGGQDQTTTGTGTISAAFVVVVAAFLSPLVAAAAVVFGLFVTVAIGSSSIGGSFHHVFLFGLENVLEFEHFLVTGSRCVFLFHALQGTYVDSFGEKGLSGGASIGTTPRIIGGVG